MSNSIPSQVIKFFRFMRLFQITMFSILRMEAEYIYAIVAWEEDCVNGIPVSEDTQMVRWTCDPNSEIDDALTLGEYAYDAGMISSDKITVDKNELQQLLGWDNQRTDAAFNKLLQIRVSMIDNDEESDNFFFHR